MLANPLPDLRPDEDIIWHARQHWSLPARRALLPALLPPLAIALALTWPRWTAALPAPWPQVASGTLLVVTVLALARLLWLYLDWTDDMLVMTSQRLALLQKTAFFHESRREIPLDRVQNITVSTSGLLPIWLKYGDLLVEAAGVPPLLAEAIPRPHDLRQRLFELRAQQRQQANHQRRLADDLAVRAALEGDPYAESRTPPLSLVWRRHWWFLARASLRPLGLLALVVAGAIVGPTLPGLRDELVPVFALALFGLVLVSLGSLVWAFLCWREDRYVLDGERLLDIKRRPLRLSHEVTQTTLDRVQDVSYRVPNPLAHLLNYGDVSIETAGETQRFTFDGVAHPRAVHAEIGRRVAALRAAERERGHQQTRDEVLAYLRAYQAMAQAQPPPPPAAPIT